MMTRILLPAARAVGTAMTLASGPASSSLAVSAMNDGTAQPAATRVAPRERKLRRESMRLTLATRLLQCEGDVSGGVVCQMVRRSERPCCRPERQRRISLTPRATVVRCFAGAQHDKMVS